MTPIRTLARALVVVAALTLILPACASGADDEEVSAIGAEPTDKDDEQEEGDKEIGDLDIGEFLPPTDLPARGDGTDSGAGDVPGPEPTVGATAGGPSLCDDIPDAAIVGALGGVATDVTGLRDSCTLVRQVGTDVAAVTSVSLSEVSPGLALSSIVDPVAESLDYDGVAQPIDIGDDAYVMEGDLGLYLYALSGTTLVVVFATDLPDPQGSALRLAAAMFAA